MLSSNINTTHQDPFAEPQAPREQAEEQAPSLDVSASTSATVSNIHSAAKEHRAGPKPLIKFEVRNPKRTNGTFKTTTYFPVDVELLVENSAAYAEPLVPQPEYLRGAEVPRIQRNNLAVGQCMTVDRRYSDFRILRDLLTYFFPHLVLPPLEPKSLLSHMETFFNAKDEISMQRESLRFFLQELATIPDVVFFAPYFARFFTEVRDTFQSVVRPEMLKVLEWLEQSSSHVRCYTKRRDGGGQNAADRIATQSTKVIRGLVNYFSKSTDTRYANAESYMYDFDLTETQEYMLPPDGRKWLVVAQKLVKREVQLKKSSASFEAYLRAMNGKAKSELEVKAGLLGTGHTFEEERDPQRFFPVLKDVGEYFESSAQTENEYIRKKYLNVVFRLECERLYVFSALDAIDHILCLYTRSAEVSATSDTDKEVTERLSKMLRENYENVYLKYYRLRMQQMSEKELSWGWKNMATQINETAKIYLGKAEDNQCETR